MKNIMSIFSWIASALMEGISPGCLVVDNVVEGLKRYNESITQIAESMQRSWDESIRTLKIALGENHLLSPKSRKQIAKKFAQEVITPFAVRNGHTGEKLEFFCQNALQQCHNLEKISKKIIDFSKYTEQDLLNHLITSEEHLSSKDISDIVIENIEKELPASNELIQILQFRNLLIEGLVAHFHLEISSNANLAAIIDRLDRQKIQKSLDEIQQQIHLSVESKDFAKLSVLGPQATKLTMIDEVFSINQEYKNLLGAVMHKLDHLAEDHHNINAKLDQVLQVLNQIQNAPKDSYFLLQSEVKLVHNINMLVEDDQWDFLPLNHRLQIINTLIVEERISKTINILQKLVDKGTQDENVYWAYFKVLRDSGNYTKAIEMYQMAITCNKNLELFPSKMYKMLAIIAKGRTGFVYRALDIQDNTIVAIKVLQSEEISSEKRLELWKSLKNAYQLQHENIVKVYDFFDDSDLQLWIAMEYVEGFDLQRDLYNKNVSLEQKIDVAIKIGKTIDYAHKKTIIHGDLKPSNCIKTKNGLKIVDFGLTEWKNQICISSEFYSSLYYLSPEELSDPSKGPTIYSDIYSFGKTLYYLFTGDEPYDMQLDVVPTQTKQIIKKATHKSPKERYASMADLVEDLEKLARQNQQPSRSAKKNNSKLEVSPIRLTKINLIDDISRCS